MPGRAKPREKATGLPTVEEFRELRALIDKYLISDLRTMLLATEPSGVGFPMLQTLLGGMELIGTLIGGNFQAFYRELSKDHPQYGPAENFFRRAVRNTTAHGYLLHTGIEIDKDGLGNLTTTTDGAIHLDLMTMHGDFIATYQRVMDELESGSGELRARGFEYVWNDLHEHEDEVKNLAALLPGFPALTAHAPSPSTSGTLLSGPSGVPSRSTGGEGGGITPPSRVRQAIEAE